MKKNTLQIIKHIFFACVAQLRHQKALKKIKKTYIL